MTDEKQHSNRLANEKSPYLLQHAHNPVDWYAWGEEAFQKAQSENKPIFLSIGYATCHWCHVMEHESFENEDIAKLMNELFVNIKVDREERPDVDQIYMTAVQAMTGGGGWPLSAFLTPDRKPFYGGTYFPPDRRYGRPGFPDILKEIARLWRDDHDRIVTSGTQLVEAIEKGLAPSPGEGTSPLPDEELLKKFYQIQQRSFDPNHGGFGPAPKFPRSDMLSLFLRIHRRTGEERAIEMAERTLGAMAKGGIYDHLGGGFARYATDERWLIPHFEKMLYDNALLAQTYLEAYQLTHNEDWASVARETLDYILRNMSSPEGGFYSAEDADSEGEEGKFYVWPEAELKAVLSETEFSAFKEIFPLSLASILDEKFVLHMGSNVAWSARYQEEIQDILKKLYEHRSQRVRPLLDDKILTSWNGLMISAMAKAARVLDDSKYLAAAQKAAQFILETMWDGTTLLRRYRKGEARYSGSLDDYAFLTAALLDLYEVDFDMRWYDAALSIQNRSDELFWDSKQGAYFFTDGTDASLLTRTKELFDGALPAANSIAAMNLLRVYHYTMNDTYRQRWEDLIKAMSERLTENPQIAPQLLASVDFATDATAEIVIAGLKSDPKVQEMLGQLAKDFRPNKVLALADSVEPERIKKMPLIEGKVPQADQATIYICRNHTCQQPVLSWKDAQALLNAKSYPLA